VQCTNKVRIILLKNLSLVDGRRRRWRVGGKIERKFVVVVEDGSPISEEVLARCK